MHKFLEETILEAGRMCLDFSKTLGDINISRKSEKDLVTEADVAVEKFITSQIKKKYPDCSILGEEGGETLGGEYRWIIDPIDGTTSFVHAQPFYCVSIALENKGVLELGAVYAPALGELFFAQRGCGATLNGKQISVSHRSEFGDCVLATGFACIRSGERRNNLPIFNSILPKIRGIRRYGSAAMDLCYVACGRLDGFWELNLNLYDIAAGRLILEEAGGSYSDFSGNLVHIPYESAASNRLIHERLLTEINSV